MIRLTFFFILFLIFSCGVKAPPLAPERDAPIPAPTHSPTPKQKAK